MTTIQSLKIGANIRQMRKSWQWNLSELARRSGIAKGLLHRIENIPTANVTIATLIALANALEVEVTELITFTP